MTTTTLPTATASTCPRSARAGVAAVPIPEALAVLAARTAVALEASLTRFQAVDTQNLGHLEIQVVHDVQELQRTTTQRAAQAKADAIPPRCPPAVQAMAALAASKLPVAEASVVLEQLAGVSLPPATLDREAKRQGQRAQRLRTQLDQQAAVGQKQLELVLEPYQLIIQLDAWNIRERDAWGQTATFRRCGHEPERWHWVYTGTVFRLDQRGETAGGRPVIVQRGYVFTRQGLDALREQVHAEALRRGLGQAASVLVIGDGAVWIWRLADDRWPQAKQRLDFYHAVQHLVAVGRALWGEDKAQFHAWLKPLVRQLKNESAVKVIRQLDQALAGLPTGPVAEAVAKEVAYFREHQDRMDYRAARRAGEPIGSGPVEATCRQGQCRFKRPGQFWSTAGDEALLCLETFWRNERWNLLFPHIAYDPSRN